MVYQIEIIHNINLIFVYLQSSYLSTEKVMSILVTFQALWELHVNFCLNVLWNRGKEVSESRSISEYIISKHKISVDFSVAFYETVLSKIYGGDFFLVAKTLYQLVLPRGKQIC